MPQTSIVLSGDALGQVAVLAFFFLCALYFVVKKAVIAALRTERSAEGASQGSTSTEGQGG